MNLETLNNNDMLHTFLVAYTQYGTFVLNTNDSLLPNTADSIELKNKMFFFSHRKIIDIVSKPMIQAQPLTYIPLSRILMMQEMEFDVPLESIRECEMNDKELSEYNARKLDHEAHHADNVDYPQ